MEKVIKYTKISGENRIKCIMDLPQLGHGRLKSYYYWLNTESPRQKEQKASVRCVYTMAGATPKMTKLRVRGLAKEW